MNHYVAAYRIILRTAFHSPTPEVNTSKSSRILPYLTEFPCMTKIVRLLFVRTVT